MTNNKLADIVQWDIASWAACIELWEKRIERDLSGQSALEIGSRKGGLTLWAALRGASCVCSDLESPAGMAGELHRKYGIAHNVVYESIDACHIPYRDAFDFVLFKSVLGAIGRFQRHWLQQQAIQSMYDALRPGGRLLFAENLAGSTIHGLFRKAFVPWGDSWRYVSLAEMNEMMRVFPRFELYSTGFFAAFGRNEKQRRGLAWLDTLVFNKVVPAEAKYIAYGIAVK